ncbi:hypothetical protein BDR07DRAFT_1481221 [Suillus spraguei]|nr:hypothetical protein BDR07DRAFT_1481221 [Suillus spraguei]
MSNHINCEMWKGNIIASQCNLPSAWAKERKIALSILSLSEIDHTNFSFLKLFYDPAINMLHSFSQNKYFSISDEDSEDAVTIAASVQPIVQEMIPKLEEDSDGDAEELMLIFEEALIAESASSDLSVTQHPAPMIDPTAPPLSQGPSICPNDYLLFKGRWIHKQTICQLVNKRVDMSAGCIMDANLFLVGDIYPTLLHSGQTLSVVNTTIMKACCMTGKVTRQLLTIIPTHPSPKSPQTSFLRNGGYVKCPRSLIEPINPEPTFICLHKDINTDDFLEIKGRQTTWQVSADTLQAACDLLWAKAIEMKVPLKSITSINPSDPKNFPYRLSDGSPAIVSVEASALLAASRGKHLTVCPLCEANVSDMRCHMVSTSYELQPTCLRR